MERGKTNAPRGKDVSTPTKGISNRLGEVKAPRREKKARGNGEENGEKTHIQRKTFEREQRNQGILEKPNEFRNNRSCRHIGKFTENRPGTRLTQGPRRRRGRASKKLELGDNRRRGRRGDDTMGGGEMRKNLEKTARTQLRGNKNPAIPLEAYLFQESLSKCARLLRWSGGTKQIQVMEVQAVGFPALIRKRDF